MTEGNFRIFFFVGLIAFWFFVAWRSAQTKIMTIPSGRTVSNMTLLLGVQTIAFVLIMASVSQADRIKTSNEIGLLLLFGVPAIMLTGVATVIHLLEEQSNQESVECSDQTQDAMPTTTWAV